MKRLQKNLPLQVAFNVTIIDKMTWMTREPKHLFIHSPKVSKIGKLKKVGCTPKSSYKQHFKIQELILPRSTVASQLLLPLIHPPLVLRGTSTLKFLSQKHCGLSSSGPKCLISGSVLQSNYGPKKQLHVSFTQVHRCLSVLAISSAHYVSRNNNNARLTKPQ